MIDPDKLFVGVSCSMRAPAPQAPHVEVGADFVDLPSATEIRQIIGDRSATMLGWHVLTHRRNDPRYRTMTDPPPEHAAVGHFDRSRWTDEAWTHTDALARALSAQAVVFPTPTSFRSSAEHAMRLENFVAHAMRPGLALAWEWAPGSWPEQKALDLCQRIGALPVTEPTQNDIPESEFVYLRFRGGRSGRTTIKDEDLKRVALAVRDRIGWVIFSNSTGAQDCGRLLEML
ncbi:MAG: hypothetical protein WDA27_10520 [Actinomycetota bacterium]